jgi:hypothetical protein
LRNFINSGPLFIIDPARLFEIGEERFFAGISWVASAEAIGKGESLKQSDGENRKPPSNVEPYFVAQMHWTDEEDYPTCFDIVGG